MSTAHRIRMLWALVVLGTAACTRETLVVTNPEDEPPFDQPFDAPFDGPSLAPSSLTIDRTEYVARHESGVGNYREYAFTMVVQFRNKTSDPLFLARCYPDSPGPIYGVELVDEGDSWGSAYSALWACVGHDRQLRVDPGAVRADTLRVRGPNAWDGRGGKPYGALTGRMRLRYSVQSCRGDGRACPPAAARSKVFRVELEH